MTRRARGTSSRRAPRRPRPRRRPRRHAWVGLAALGLVLTGAAALFGYQATRVHPSPPAPVILAWPAATNATEGARLLAAAGLPHEPWVLHAVLALAGVFLKMEPGAHVLMGPMSATEVVRRLARLRSRDQVKVTIPEGFNQFQIAERLQGSGVCPARAFLAAAQDPILMVSLGMPLPSAEGFLFPATYDAYLDSRPGDLVRTMAGLGLRRFTELAEQHRARMGELDALHGWQLPEVLTLASIVEKEAAVPEERALIASVFFNRLRDPQFRPAHMLQSDPTAGYGCLLQPNLDSCRGFSGRITPAMLRDMRNPYNTYRHPGLPPGPIANPGQEAVRAVLAPAETDYLFFVAQGGRRHTFSRTLAEHEAAIHRRQKPAVAPSPSPSR